MKNYKIISWFLFLFLIVAVSFALVQYIRAQGDIITVCVKKDGIMHMVGGGFTRMDCKDNESLLSWNVEGPQGPKGDMGDKGDQGIQGERGLPAQHGAGNIAFIFEDYLLKTDGTVWVAGANPGNIPPYTRIDGINYSGVTNVPILVSDIISWQYSRIIDRNGNYWFICNCNVKGGWKNFGQLP